MPDRSSLLIGNTGNPDDGPSRQSIPATYDRRETGDRFTVTTCVGHRRIDHLEVPDPFVNTTVHIGWRDLLRGLVRRRLSVNVVVSGDHEIVEDVVELDNDYKGELGSSRRREWDQQLDGALRDFAAREAEHDV